MHRARIRPFLITSCDGVLLKNIFNVELLTFFEKVEISKQIIQLKNKISWFFGKVITNLVLK